MPIDIQRGEPRRPYWVWLGRLSRRFGPEVGAWSVLRSVQRWNADVLRNR